MRGGLLLCLSGVDKLVLSLSARTPIAGEVAAYLAEVYGAQVYRQTMSTITDKVIEGMAGLARRSDGNRIVHDPGAYRVHDRT